VFGVAVLASVFALKGVYTSPVAFADGFRAALWVAVGFSIAGALAALTSVMRPARRQQRSRAQAALVEAGDQTTLRSNYGDL
jgi:hypothetical protein